jgi:hypothetical protein
MSLWLVIALLGLLKLPLAGLMLWLPFRHDEALSDVASDAPDASDEDGGSRTLPAGARDPHPRLPLPRRPRRGPHGGAPAPPSPPRVRIPVGGARRVHSM